MRLTANGSLRVHKCFAGGENGEGEFYLWTTEAAAIRFKTAECRRMCKCVFVCLTEEIFEHHGFGEIAFNLVKSEDRMPVNRYFIV